MFTILATDREERVDSDAEPSRVDTNDDVPADRADDDAWLDSVAGSEYLDDRIRQTD